MGIIDGMQRQIEALLGRRATAPAGLQGSLMDLKVQMHRPTGSLRGIRGCNGLVPAEGGRYRICSRVKGHDGEHANAGAA